MGENKTFGFNRDFPEDAHMPTLKEYASWGRDAHTPGWCTLKELKEAVSKVNLVARKGFVSKEAANTYRKTGETPECWAQGVGTTTPDRFEWLEWEDEVHCFDYLIKALDERKRDVFWIHREEHDDGSHDEKIRIVFWFDN